MTVLKLFLLGPPRVEQNGAPVEIRRNKALALLIYLAVSGQPHSRDTLVTLFYPDKNQSRARSYLRRDLAVLNTSLAGGWLIADRATTELKPGFWLDLAQFRQYLTSCRSHAHLPDAFCDNCIPLLTEAVELYTDDFLAGFSLPDCPEFDEWQFFQGDSLRQESASALERLVQQALELWTEIGHEPYRAWVLGQLGYVFETLGDERQAEASQCFEKALQLSIRHKLAPLAMDVFVGVARILLGSNKKNNGCDTYPGSYQGKGWNLFNRNIDKQEGGSP